VRTRGRGHRLSLVLGQSSGSIDGLAALALAAKATTRIDLGIGVIPLHTRGSESIAQGVKAQGLPTGRLLLGVGSPNPGSLARVREGIAALRAALPGTRLVVAALGPKMCRLAGEIADGVLFNWLTPEWAKTSAAWVHEGAVAARRQPPTLYAYVRVALGAAAAATLAEEGRRYAGIPAYAAHFERMGVKPVDTAVSVMTPDASGPRWRDGRARSTRSSCAPSRAPTRWRRTRARPLCSALIHDHDASTPGARRSGVV
jgi:alkanesulfonate monooxygenase SsuD/methylene tetrahydromethanopterin reductase-like flavin-dependent oxidoreductase (luciferase family)